MAKKVDCIQTIIETYEIQHRDATFAIESIQESLKQLLQDKEASFLVLTEKYQLMDEDHINDFLECQKQYNEKIQAIEQKYLEQFDTLELETNELNLAIEQESTTENSKYEMVVSDILDLKNNAYQRFLELVETSNNRIDEEMQVHTDFIKSENEKFEETLGNYQSLQSNQSNQLLWSIEQSKNALLELNQELEEKTANQVSYMNDTILDTLHSLRSTRNKMSALFKSATDIYSKQKDRINQLSHQRQKPHSLINQTVIRQYVKQIKDINLKKLNFEKLIQKELTDSKETIGKRIIEANNSQNTQELEKYIIQYEIIQHKANYLLKRNQSMADLLISKYQSEIKKIKIDSFKRVEEIKLAYYMPAMFFQNSINLFSNFSFYVNDSFDELDGLLSDLILYNKQYQDSKTKYVENDSKTLEDYKINLMVKITNVCSSLTDMITQIDAYSKDIITLESANQLEIAEVRKKMENTEIQGDYDKYIKSLETDHFFADHQHESNIAAISLKHKKEASLIKIQREVAFARQKHEIELAKVDYLKQIAFLEDVSHQVAYQKDLDLAKKRYAFLKKENDIHFELNVENIKSTHLSSLYHLAHRFLEEENIYLESKKRGSEEVISFVHHAQNIIDLNQSQTNAILKQIEQHVSPKTYAYYLEVTRNKLLRYFDIETEQKIKINRQAVEIIHHEFYTTLLNIQMELSVFTIELKNKLLLLDQSNVEIIKNNIITNHLSIYTVLKLSEIMKELIGKLYHNHNQNKNTDNTYIAIDQFCENYIIKATQTLKQISSKNSRYTLRLLKDFYTISIIESNKLDKTIQNHFDEISKSIIEPDIIYIQRALEKATKAKNMINKEYDCLIVKAVNQDRNRVLQVNQLIHDTKELDYTFKNQVKQINHVYEKSVDEEEQRIEFIKAEVNSLMKESKKLVDKELKLLKASYQKEQISIDQRMKSHEKAFDTIINSLKSSYEEDILYAKNLEQDKTIELETTLKRLEQELLELPNEFTSKMTSLEVTKSNLITEKQQALLQEYTHIEEHKFASLPAYIAEIESIKERLPKDYLAIYQNISKAEENFLNQYLNINVDYIDDFEDFLSTQKDTGLNEKYLNIFNHPFEVFQKLEDDLLSKNKNVYSDTLFKLSVSKTEISSEELKYTDKQNRIIND